MDVKKELDKLRREVEYHNKMYHVYDAPVISDYEYDIGEDTLYKILEDVRRPDAYQMVVIIDVAGADDLEAMKRMRAFTRYLARIGKLNEYNITR